MARGVEPRDRALIRWRFPGGRHPIRSRMTAGKRRVRGAAFKAQVGLAAAKGDRTTAQLASQFGIPTSQVTACKKQLVAEATELVAHAEDRPPEHQAAVLRHPQRLQGLWHQPQACPSGWSPPRACPIRPCSIPFRPRARPIRPSAIPIGHFARSKRCWTLES